jgi:LruC domain-containing protein
MKNRSLLTLLFVVLGLYGCNKTSPTDPDTKKTMENLQVPSDFSWSTTKPCFIVITALDNLDEPIIGAKFLIFTKDPELGGTLILSGVTDYRGKYEVNYQVPAYYTELYITTNYVGLPSDRVVALTSSGLDVVFGGKQTTANTIKENVVPKATKAIYKFMGTYNSNGVPGYLEPENDPISADFLKDINNTLPEQLSLPESHPEYFSEMYDHNIRLVETCDVWVTFVTEGAGYKNVLGFYTYPTDAPPQTPGDIDSITIIFPNASLDGSGGGLKPGNKVKIGRFNANTTIGWALIADGWVNKSVTDGKWIVYSTRNLNPSAQTELKQQSVLLLDPGRGRFLLGFEDIKRNSSGCDHDFNDAVFFVTANPVQAVDPTNLPIVDYTGEDADADGITDQFDDYPNDPARAFNNYFFNQGNFGTLAFEDLWPYRGDYDFNDAVIDYNFNQITNGNNAVIEIEATFILRAHGAYFHNGFGFQLPVPHDAVKSVEGTRISADYVSLQSNGTEQGQEKATIIVWDDSYEVLPQIGTGIGVNTHPELPFSVPDTLRVKVLFRQPIPLHGVGIPPYNPFIIVDQQRGIEVHLPDHQPTELADLSLLGSGHDNSIPAAGRFYKTSNNLPWAINIVERFEYPIEKAEILEVHLKFGEWAESGGQRFNDWFKTQEGYRNNEKIYHPTAR